jgi:hypothetical protein
MFWKWIPFSFSGGKDVKIYPIGHIDRDVLIPWTSYESDPT